jgi:hypothetical protein
MDLDFLAKLDEQVSNVGRNECWKREVGGRVVWFSPISYTAQLKVTETITTEGVSGAFLIAESKRVSLSYAIVGLDDIDLRLYRDAGEIFTIPDPRKPGETVKVDLAKYIHSKMAAWGNDWMDTAFDVFADLMESFNKGNKSKIRFENIKDPYEELVEIEMRSAELRKELKMPILVEKPAEATEKSDPILEAKKDIKKPLPDPQAVDAPFDPFKSLPTVEKTPEPVAPAPVTLPIVPNMTLPVSDMNGMSPIEQAMASRKSVIQSNILEYGAPQSTPDKPFVGGLPSVSNDVLDQRTPQQQLPPPVINKTMDKQSINPRFSKPTR